MFRKFVAAAVALVVFAGGLAAAEYQGQLKKVDAEKGTITIAVKKGDTTEDKTIMVGKECKFVTGNERIAEQLKTQGLKHQIFTRTGERAPQVTVKTEGEGDKEMATEIRVGGRRPQN